MTAAAFFDSVRERLFDGTLTQPQVDGLNALLAAWTDQDLRWTAYGLATAYHETDMAMQPVAEWGHGHGRPYGEPDPVTHLVYYGRGYVQLTWAANYLKLGKAIGVDLYHAPERALEPEIAAKIMLIGMTQGAFTDKKLADYFNKNTTDFYNARRIINGLDRANLIAGYARKFLAALEAKA